jgi:hypothetical protein
MINTGFIMLQREIVNWEWYTDVNTCKLFVHCLLKVNYSKKKWQGYTINKGEFITSYEKLAVETGLSVSKVRTALSKLINTDHILVEPTTHFTKIIIPKLNDFVVKTNQLQIDTQNDTQNDTQINEPLTNNSQVNHNQITTTNTNKKNIKKRKNIFRDKVYAFSKFNSKDLDSFFNYWSELTIDKTEMRCEEQKFFEIEKRLEKWVLNNFKRGKVSKSNNDLIINR